jgi:hypothetical protein
MLRLLLLLPLLLLANPSLAECAPHKITGQRRSGCKAMP